MNKKLIALAVAAAIAPAAALADSGNVTIYGRAHVSLDHNNYGTATESNNRVSSNSSRLGFKGSEDLGNGLSAIWQMEADINMDSRADAAAATTGGFASRNTFLGLSSKTMGTVLFGKHDTPYKLATGSLDNMSETVGDYNGIIGSASAAPGVFDARLGNVSAYISPTWSGFHFAAAIVAANETSNQAAADPKAYSLMGMYANGPLMVSLAREKASDTDGVANTQTALPAVGAGNNASATKLGLGYTIDALKLGLIWEKISTSTAIAPGLERSAWAVPVSYKMGNNTINFTYAKAGNSTTVADDGAKMMAIGVDHNFSKRTSVYAVYAKMDNGATGSYDLGVSGHGQTLAAAAGNDLSSLSVGMKHDF